MNKKRMNAMLGSVTALCMTCTTMSNAIVFAQDNTFEVINENTKETTKPDWNSEASKDKTVFYNGQYFPLLTEALTAAYKDTATTGVKEIHCKPGADVGLMQHGHVADDLIIYGNGAYVSASERDLEIDTYKYDRKTGKQSESGEYLEKDITVTVNDLNGIAAWGQRNTAHKITLNFNNCKNMHRVYFSGTTGENDINLNNCSFNANGDENGNLKSYNSPVYSNANGKINIENCEFNGIDIAINLNHKVAGEQTIQVKNTTFTNCGLATDNGTKTYAAPIRVVASVAGSQSNLSVENCEFIYTDAKKNCGNGDILLGDGQSGASENPGVVTLTMSETSNLSVENCEFIYTDAKKNCGNGDILLGDGQSGASENPGVVTLTMSETKADVMAQKKGYFGADGNVANKDNATSTTVQENEVVNKQEVTANKPVEVQPAPNSGSGSGGATVKVANKDNATSTTVQENEVVNKQEVTANKPVEVQPAPNSGSGSGGATVKLNPVYRAYNPNNGEHLYTVDEKEYKHVASVGWDAEGVAFMAEEEKNGQALYRVYNPNSGLHHYTLDEKEKNTLVSLGWHDEKVAWYTSKKPQSAPVFRVYNPNDGNHHYTMNKQEKDVLVSYGWQNEGIAFRTAPIEK